MIGGENDAAFLFGKIFEYLEYGGKREPVSEQVQEYPFVIEYAFHIATTGDAVQEKIEKINNDDHDVMFVIRYQIDVTFDFADRG